MRDEFEVWRAQVADLTSQLAAAHVEVDQLKAGMATARTIGAAVGVLMATLRVTEQVAFDVLRVASQNSNRKLRDVASDVVRTGALEIQHCPSAPGSNVGQST